MSPYGGMLVEQSEFFRETVVPNVTWMLVDRAMVLSNFLQMQLRERRRAPGSVSGPSCFGVSGKAESAIPSESVPPGEANMRIRAIRCLRESRICDFERF